ncbi:MAG TPA: inositol monophosphatase family protein [Usitatibacteraceae bacterium]|nr:inositol monophosphatase family protein [Usitatibacteraceae bacterium]
MDDAPLAELLARLTGQLLIAARDSIAIGQDELGAVGDRIANRMLVEALASIRPDDSILSEEDRHGHFRPACARNWLLDPLDGTREYSLRAADRPDWAVHVALVREESPIAAAVAIPVRRRSYATHTAALQSRPRASSNRLVVSRTRAPAAVQDVAQALGLEVIRMGSAGAKAMAVVEGDADAYWHSGGLAGWDACAPVAVARAAGLHVSHADGSECRFRHDGSWRGDLVICDKAIADRLLRAIQGTTNAP